MKKKLLGFLGVCALAFLVSAPTTVKAGTTYTEVEDNNTAQTANEVTVTSGTNVINGVVTIGTDEKKGFKEDKYDWYKITFAEQGKCNFKFVCTSDPTISERMYKDYVECYDSDFNKCDSFYYDLAHDANETYYIRVEANVVDSISTMRNPKTYTLTLTEDTTQEYVGEQHSKMQNAYLLTRGKKAYAAGLTDSHQRWFAIKVPSGKKATITFAPVADADMNEIIKNNYIIKIVRGSDNEELGRANDIKAKFDKSKCGNTEFVGADTYYVCVSGGYYGIANNQWYSLSYDLTNAKPLDKTKPIIKGVKNGTTYKKVVTIKFSDKSGIRKATLNGKKIKSGTKVKKNGSYTLIVTDKAGNSRTVRFKIRK